MKPAIFALFLLLQSSFVFAQKNVAIVKLLRGEADVLVGGKTVRLKVEDWVKDGATIKTSEKSFVKLVFVDKSQMNVGPNSEMKIEKFSDKDSGVIDLVKGKIRSQVTKDYLQINKDKSKLFIKTQNAVMGVRGTDFMISTNGINTSTILFEGEIAFNKLDVRGELSTSKLEEIVDRGVSIYPGEFSVVETDRPLPTMPALLNIQQRENLEKNDSFDADRAPGNSGAEEAKKSIVPEGLSGQIVSNNNVSINSEIQVSAPVIDTQAKVPTSAANPDGYVQGDKIKPTNGSFVHLDSGTIIPPGPDSALDSNTNTYMPFNKGTVSSGGDYIPPKNFEITPNGDIMKAVTDAKGNTVVQKVEKEVPVMSRTVATGTTSSAIGSPTAPMKPLPSNDILNSRATPQGMMDVSNNSRNVTGGVENINQVVNLPPAGKTDTTIIVNPNPTAGP